MQAHVIPECESRRRTPCTPDVQLPTPRLVTDVTIVYPDPTGHIGLAAKAARKVKEAKYGAAVRALDDVFIPFAMEVYGHFDADCIRLIRRLSDAVPLHMQRLFVRDVTHAVSTALARSVATTFMAVDETIQNKYCRRASGFGFAT